MTEKLFNKRLSILTNSERKLIYDIPKFTNQERKYYFNLKTLEQDIVFNQFNGIHSRIYFILQLGYFKASLRFFKFNFCNVLEDIQYILQKYFPEHLGNLDKEKCNKKTILNHRSIILKLFSYRSLSKEDYNNIFKKAKSIVSIDANPKYIFKEIVRFTNDNKLILPAYSTIQEIISKAIVVSEKSPNRFYSKQTQ